MRASDMRFKGCNRLAFTGGVIVFLSLNMCCLSAEEGGGVAPAPLPAEEKKASPSSVAGETSLSSAAEEDRIQVPAEGAPYLVGPRDVLSVSVYGEKDLTGTYTVSPGGTIHMGWLGEVPVSGFTVEEVDARLTDILGEKFIRDPRVQVRVTGFHSKKAYLFGRVARPGVYELKEEITLLDLLLMAEGPSKLAGDKVTILRFPEGKGGEPEKITVRLFRLLVQGDASQNVSIKDGDIVTVSEMGQDAEAGLSVAEGDDRVYIVGAVERPGAFPWRDDLSALDLVLSANGLNEFASGNKAKIIRKKGSEHEEIQIRLKDILRGDRTKNVLLKPGDWVFVPESFF